MNFLNLSPEQLSLQQQQQIFALQSNANSQNAASMLAMSSANNAAQMAANQMRMQQLQAEMLRGQQLIAQQLDWRRSETRAAMAAAFQSMPGAYAGTTGFGGRNVGLSPGGFYQQSFGGLVADAGLSQLMNASTRGVFFKDANVQFGASKQQTQQMSRSELRQRVGGMDSDFVNSIKQNLPGIALSAVGLGMLGSDWASTPNNFLGMGPIDRYKHLRGDVSRNLQTRFSNLRGADIANGSGLADGIGVDLQSAFVKSARDRIFEQANVANRRLGNSISDENMTLMSNAAITSLDDRVIRKGARMANQKEGGAFIGEEAGKVVVEMKKLADALGMNEKAISELVVQNKRAGFTFQQLQASTSSVSRMQTGSSIPVETLAAMHLSYRTAGRSQGFGDGSTYANTQFGLNQQMEEDMKDNPNLLYMYGGSNDSEAAMNYRGAMNGFGANVKRKFGRSLGILAMNEGNPLAAGEGLMGMASVGARLGKNPYAGLQAEQSETGSRRMGLLGREILFDKINELGNRGVFGPDKLGAHAMKVKMYAENMEMTDMVAANKDFTQQTAQRAGTRTALASAGLSSSDKTASDVDAMSTLANEAGSPVTDMSTAEKVDMYKKWIAGGRKSTDDDFRELVPDRVRLAWESKEETGAEFSDARTFTAFDQIVLGRDAAFDDGVKRVGILDRLSLDSIKDTIAKGRDSLSSHWYSMNSDEEKLRLRTNFDTQQRQYITDIMGIANASGGQLSEEAATRLATGGEFSATEANKAFDTDSERRKLRDRTRSMAETAESLSKRNAESSHSVTIADFSDQGLNRFISSLQGGMP